MRRADRQLRRDRVGLLAAAVTLLPAAAIPFAGLAGGGYVMSRPGLPVWVAAALVAGGLVSAPLAWRVVGPLTPRLFGPSPHSRVEELTSIQADMTQTQAAELERIERGLHDGAQARIVAFGMTLGTAERLIDSDPQNAKAILAAARASPAEALAELRLLVRGINPPVLSERGLVDAVRALALDAPLPVSVTSSLPARPERPIEAAAYFAIAELLANIAKYANAATASVDLHHDGRTLQIMVSDDGVGGAAFGSGSGLPGIARRLAPFDGTIDIHSPLGGPTRITLAMPCALS